MLLAYLFFLHFIADFVLQSREMGKRKSTDLWYLTYHVIIQMTVMFLGTYFVLGDVKAFHFATLNGIIHGVIDWNVWKMYKYYVKRLIESTHGSDPFLNTEAANQWRYWEDHRFYLTIGFDQFLHSITILLVIWIVL